MLLSVAHFYSGQSVARAENGVTYEVPRAGAARALRLIDAAGNPLRGSFSGAHWELRGNGLLFTREWNGARNVWRAYPDPQDNKRYPTWRALPITDYRPPVFASNPVPIPRSKALLFVSNATNPGGQSQIVRYETSNGSATAITNIEAGALDPALSADGSTLAYAVMRGGTTSVYVQNLDGGAPRRVALNARRPAWQDKSTLLLESTVNPTIFRLPLADASRPLKLSSGEQVALSREGSFLALGMSPGAAGAPNQNRLYLMAGDGSGLRAITDAADDARRPAISPDDASLCFDAPLPGAGSDRALWVLPLQREAFEPQDTSSSGDDNSRRRVVDNPMTLGNARVTEAPKTRPAAPIAQINGVDLAPGGALAILGVASGEGATATLEFGAGAKPTRWTEVAVPLPVPQNAALTLWLPPSDARGVWTIRLTVTNGGGASQSQYSIRLPVVQRKPDKEIPAPQPAGDGFQLPPGGPLPRAPLPDLPVAPALPALPLPAPAARPTPRPAPRPTPKPTPRPVPPRPVVTAPEAPSGAILPSFPNQPAITKIVPAPAPAPIPRPTPVPAPQPVPTQPPVVSQPTPKPVAVPAQPPAPGTDAATFNISGTLATMTANQKINVTFWGLNRGSRGWDMGSSGQSVGAVRLIARWIDFDSGGRRKWNLQWMKQAVPPGERTSWSFDLIAPSKPGRYKLIYGLVRVPSENWEPPAYNAPQDSWPNEFSAIAFAVNVK